MPSPLHKIVACAAAALLLLLPSCVSPFTSTLYIDSSYDHTASFGHYQSFAWYEKTAAMQGGIDSVAFSPLVDARVKEAVASELVKAGITPAHEVMPGLLVAYDIALDSSFATSVGNEVGPGFAYGYSYWYGYRYYYNFTNLPDHRTIQQYTVGTLVIDLIDANTNEVVWRGWGEANLNPSQIEEEKVNKVVARVMSQFPPIPDRAP